MDCPVCGQRIKFFSTTIGNICRACRKRPPRYREGQEPTGRLRLCPNCGSRKTRRAKEAEYLKAGFGGTFSEVGECSLKHPRICKTCNHVWRPLLNRLERFCDAAIAFAMNVLAAGFRS